jgi:hypothetical protein
VVSLPRLGAEHINRYVLNLAYIIQSENVCKRIAIAIVIIKINGNKPAGLVG